MMSMMHQENPFSQESWKVLYEETYKELHEVKESFLAFQAQSGGLQTNYQNEIKSMKLEIESLKRDKDIRSNEMFRKEREHNLEINRLNTLNETLREALSDSNCKVNEMVIEQKKNEAIVSNAKDAMNSLLVQWEENGIDEAKYRELMRKMDQKAIIIRIHPSFDVPDHLKHSSLNDAISTIDRIVAAKSISHLIPTK